MNQTIPPTLGAGDTIALEFMDVPVNIGKARSRAACVAITASPNSPIGPKVVLSVNAAAPGEDRARAHVAHLSAEEAIWLAGRLLSAVADLSDPL
jgi:hypothetical protein